jgi:hypothetical protein
LDKVIETHHLGEDSGAAVEEAFRKMAKKIETAKGLAAEAGEYAATSVECAKAGDWLNAGRYAEQACTCESSTAIARPGAIRGRHGRR